MSNLDSKEPSQSNERKKISLQEAMKQMLENKNKQTGGTSKSGSIIENTKRQSQSVKKTTTKRRKTGGS